MPLRVSEASAAWPQRRLVPESKIPHGSLAFCLLQFVFICVALVLPLVVFEYVRVVEDLAKPFYVDGTLPRELFEETKTTWAFVYTPIVSLLSTLFLVVLLTLQTFRKSLSRAQLPVLCSLMLLHLFFAASFMVVAVDASRFPEDDMGIAHPHINLLIYSVPFLNEDSIKGLYKKFRCCGIWRTSEYTNGSVFHGVAPSHALQPLFFRFSPVWRQHCREQCDVPPVCKARRLKYVIPCGVLLARLFASSFLTAASLSLLCVLLMLLHVVFVVRHYPRPSAQSSPP